MIQMAINLEHPENSSLFKVKKSFKVLYGRPKWRGEEGINLKNYEKDEKALTNIIEDEAFVLGQTHRKSLTTEGSATLENYIQEFESIPKDDWQNLSEDFAAMTEARYNATRPRR